MTEPLGAPSANSIPTATCPFCRCPSSSHEANACLDRWVHEQFLGHTVSADESVPQYSTTLQDGALDPLINARRWPQGTAVIQTSHGCTVGLMVRRSHEYEHYDGSGDRSNSAISSVSRRSLRARRRRG